MKVLVVTRRPAFWDALRSCFDSHGAGLCTTETLEEGLGVIRGGKVALAVLDTGSDIAALRKSVMDILTVNAMTNVASVSGMGEEMFHDAMEGLGMIMDLPLEPEEADVARLLEALKVILG